ncbi:MAG TPA: NAD(P)/FAD-dependent oxidoreductase [Methylophilaceae bacterium]|nr:NAD(P)/FAD-dependent oxidoreductase [Methylophilaceae bacterium]
MSRQRRDFLKVSAAAALTAAMPRFANASTWARRRLVVVGGGFAGATVAKYLRLWTHAQVDVVMVEPSSTFISCPMSNLVLGGSRNLSDLTFGYGALQQRGIDWIQDAVTAINVESKKLVLRRGELSYDKLILAPGVDFIYDHLPSLQSEVARNQIPHAWKAGEQTLNLHKQLRTMPHNGTFVISIPLMPYRCPPGPYERACQVAAYFKKHKPRAKVLVLDANPDIVSKKGLFTRAWKELYPGIIEYRPNSAVVDINVATRTVQTEFDTVKSHVLNFIPPQRAGLPAQLAGVANIDRGWCEVNFVTYASQDVPDVHVIGDAVSAGLPKSAHMATSHAHVCAAALAAMMQDEAPDPAPVFANTCYSFVDDRKAMHVAHVYRFDANKKMMLPAEGGGVSEYPSEQEGIYAHDWAQNIWSDVLT